MSLSPDTCWSALATRDARFDGWFYVGVVTTGIYCRPSCPARPHPENVRFYATAAAAQAAGLRACKRCRPDAVPGSPEWDRRADAVGRAMRLVADGVVDRDGVSGLAAALGYSERHLGRLLIEEVGVGPLALARARRAHAARILLETTDVRVTDVVWAAGFGSVRQFNDTIREVFAMAPRELRARSRRGARPAPGEGIALRLPARAPLDADGLLDFFAARAIAGIDEVDGEVYRRSLSLPNGPGVVELTLDGSPTVGARFRLHDLRDLGTAAQRCRALLDLDADPVAVGDALGADPVIGPLVRARPGLRVPGTVDGFELAVRAVLGQQVSVRGAATLAGAARARARRAAARARRRRHPRLPDRRGARRARPGDRGDAAHPRPRAGRPVTGRRRGRARARPRRRRRGGPRDAREPPGHRPVDGRVRRPARAARPRRLRLHRPRRPPRSGRARRDAAAADAWHPYRAYANQHLWTWYADGAADIPKEIAA